MMSARQALHKATHLHCLCRSFTHKSSPFVRVTPVFTTKLSRCVSTHRLRPCFTNDTKSQGGTITSTFLSRSLSSGDTVKVKPVFLQAKEFNNKLAFISQHGRYTFNDLYYYSLKLAEEIYNHVCPENGNNGKNGGNTSELPLLGERIAFLCENDMSYLITQWAIWLNGGIAVPLCKSHPESEMEYFVSDSGSSLIIATDDFAGRVTGISENLGIPLMLVSPDDYGGDYNEKENPWVSHGVDRYEVLQGCLAEDKFRDMKAMIIYTSGTTGRPKGVVYTHGNIHAQIEGMREAWKWTPDDVILHALPLHHVHGVVNVLLTPLYCGATCIMLPKFDAASVWKMLLTDISHLPINMFMAVPTIYAKLIEEYEANKADPLYSNMKEVLKDKIRLMVSGSAALPQPVMEKWEAITGHTLLERYGMTEIGMALTNPLDGERQPGAVGVPFPGVSVRIVDNHDKGYDLVATADSQNVTVEPEKEEEQGELLVKGDNVFKEYWNKPDATTESFTDDGWFKTGDTAVFKDGAFRIVGRTSVDVLKCGGYKISALEVERHLLAHPVIKDIAVVGLPDEMWGQKIAAVVVVEDMESLDLEEMKAWAADKMAPYHIPTVLMIVDEMPRNAMGKVNKKQLAKDLFPEYF